MRTTKRHHILIGALLFSLLSPINSAIGLERLTDFDSYRVKLISYVIRKQLTAHHFSHKSLDDELSRAAFDLYLKQLDFQKRFLLRDDVNRLKAFSSRIDDELLYGKIELPAASALILEKRISEVTKMVREILSGPFDFSQREQFEVDQDNLQYCETGDELKERWRKALKYQVLTRYLNLIEENDSNIKPPADAKKGNREFQEIAREKTLKNYEEFFARLAEVTEKEHIDRYLDAIARAYDPHTDYLPPSQKEDFDISMRGSLEGIGAKLMEKDGYIKVVSIIPGGAAYRQGQLQPDDIILKVAEGNGEPVDITDMRIRKAVSLIRGKKGSTVRLTIKKTDGRLMAVPIVRDTIQIDETFVKWAVLHEKDNDTPYGYIRIPSFYRDFNASDENDPGRNSTDDVRNALKNLQRGRIKGLILDLRSNGGGALVDAVSIAGLFIKTGPIVQVKNGNDKIIVHSDEDPSIAYSGPLVVLVNKLSASASEILAGALQDYKRAIILGGRHTHGKGTVQAMIDLDQNVPLTSMGRYRPLGALKITIQKFYRISGESTQFRGVVPDIILPDTMEYLKYGEQYADYSLPWDTVKPVDYHTWSHRFSDLSPLRIKSAERVSVDTKFNEIKKEAQQVKERMENTIQSLYIDDVLNERRASHSNHTQSQSPHSSHDGPPADSNSEGDKTTTSDEQLRKKWILETSEDPYVEEAIFLLDDILFS